LEECQSHDLKESADQIAHSKVGEGCEETKQGGYRDSIFQLGPSR